MKHYLFDCEECGSMTKHELWQSEEIDWQYTAICVHCNKSTELIKED